MDDIEQLKPVAEIHEQTDSTAERLRVLCQLAESLDGSEIDSLETDADDAWAYPSLSKMSRDEAAVIRDRIAAVKEFRRTLGEI